MWLPQHFVQCFPKHALLRVWITYKMYQINLRNTKPYELTDFFPERLPRALIILTCIENLQKKIITCSISQMYVTINFFLHRASYVISFLPPLKCYHSHTNKSSLSVIYFFAFNSSLRIFFHWFLESRREEAERYLKKREKG